MTPLAGLAAIFGAVALGVLKMKGDVIDFWLSEKTGNHWAIRPASNPGPWSWETIDSQLVELISANLVPDGKGGADIIDVRWTEDSRNPFSPEATIAAKKLSITPVELRGRLR
jgi:hypothetical protein